MIEMEIQFNGLENVSELFSKPTEILSWSWGGSINTEIGKSDIQPLSMTLYHTTLTPYLLKMLTEGTLVGTVDFRCRGETMIQTMRLKNVRLTSISVGGTGHDDRFTKNITLEFESVDLTYSETTREGKNVDASVVLKKNDTKEA